jgi:hypothetical protein
MNFKTYNINQRKLILPSYDEFLDENHQVKQLIKVVDQLDLTHLYNSYDN